MKTAFVNHEDASLHDTGWNHPDHQGRLPAIVRAVQRDMVALWEPLLQLPAIPAAEADLLLAHTPAYVARVRERGIESAREGRTLELDGVPVSGASWDAALASVGAALTAVDAVLDGTARNGFALARPPGRGAWADAPGEFSLFNTVAIAARHLRARRGVGRVLVVAWGAHRPTALAQLLADDGAVRLVSVHQHPQSFPDPHPADEDPPIVAGVLTPGSGGDVFAAALRDVLDSIPPSGTPDFVLLSAGFDILAADKQGALAVQPEEVYAITTVLREWADARTGGRLVSVLEGGYAAAETARAVIQHLHALARIEPA
ncbi:histone deacetylase [Longimicrobium sp.]|uniref:histone deacetylase family protein n=1 Tax=Longimicrobium sp. TaxID=2029185 RepID=UPI002E2EC22A|nr:histone deacetylase [Longimicrobium sp.]HEX6038035.1 histone deacetylase [Longimicrobium sp.]